jgi:hypothetical protein
MSLEPLPQEVALNEIRDKEEQAEDDRGGSHPDGSHCDTPVLWNIELGLPEHDSARREEHRKSCPEEQESDCTEAGKSNGRVARTWLGQVQCRGHSPDEDPERYDDDEGQDGEVLAEAATLDQAPDRGKTRRQQRRKSGNLVQLGLKRLRSKSGQCLAREHQDLRLLINTPHVPQVGAGRHAPDGLCWLERFLRIDHRELDARRVNSRSSVDGRRSVRCPWRLSLLP